MTDHTCYTCRWYTLFEGVCCNEDSMYRTGIQNPEKGCREWDRREDAWNERDSRLYP